jgi:hypothetical protein
MASLRGPFHGHLAGRGGGQYAPIDLREHHLSDAVFFPGLHADPQAFTDAPTTELTIGKDGGLTVRIGDSTIDLGGGATDFVAMNQKVITALQDIATKFNGHTHTSGASGSPTGTPALAVTPTVITAPTSVGSTTVKVKG